MRIVAISDTHERYGFGNLPDGDVLIHAGDITKNGSISALAAFASLLKDAPHEHKIVVAGNHDFCFENENSDVAKKILTELGIYYLEDSGIIIRGLNFWGSPWQPRFYNWAFNLDRGKEIAQKWALIPANTHVLITHGPPHGILDLTNDGIHAGCEELAIRINNLKELKAHIFGHIHEGYGFVKIQSTVYVNACICDLRYRAVNLPLIIDID